MKIEHIAMYVNDLKSARDFFVKYLGCHPADYKLPLPSDCLGLNAGENTVPLKVMGTFSSYSGNLRRSQAHVTAHGSI